MKRKQRRNAFTLIEVLIVVIIMAVLAATIIPQFSQSTDDAMDSSVDFNLHTMQTQIEMYRFQHNGSWPAFANIEAQLTEATNVSGGATGDTKFGPYMQEIPANPFNESNVVVAGDGSALVGGGVAGWQYDESTGRVYANHPAAFE
jgi:prepilin-type N-terminal cleavage/methylation domain-containing protein